MAEHRKLTMYDAENVYKLVPALPKRKHESNPNDYILKAKETHELKYLFFYLDENEAYFNNQIRAYLTSESKYIAPERFMDLKLECREEVLRRFRNSVIAFFVMALLIVIVIQVLSILIMLRLTSVLGIRPVLRAVDRIKEDSPIPEAGANEFRYLAKAYNKMYARYKTSLEHLSYKASHDELTGAYNRAGYDLLLSSIDLATTYMMLLDVDNFKTINDTYGHETGDRVLIKLVQVLNSIFRDDDCICRIGGDEFVIFMVHSSGMQRKLIESKIEQINEEMENTADSLPPVTISIGIVNGRDVTDPESILDKTDAAMYESKKRGKNTYTFYTKQGQG